jgi:hypothetical protein
VRPPRLKCSRTGLAGPGVASGGIRVASRGPWLAQGPRPRATKCPQHPGTPLERRGRAWGRRVRGLGAGRGAHRAALGARGRRNRSETAQVPLGETVQGDPGDPPGRSETPSGQPQQPLTWRRWLVGLASWHLDRAVVGVVRCSLNGKPQNESHETRITRIRLGV